MTTHIQPRASRPAAPHLKFKIADNHCATIDQTVTGTSAQLASIAANYRNAGTLIAMTTPRPLNNNRFQIVMRIRAVQPKQHTSWITCMNHTIRRIRHPHRETTIIAVIITAITATAGAIAAAAAYLIGQLVELIAAHAGIILGALVLTAILAICVGRGSGRKHCPGC